MALHPGGLYRPPVGVAQAPGPGPSLSAPHSSSSLHVGFGHLAPSEDDTAKPTATHQTSAPRLRSRPPCSPRLGLLLSAPAAPCSPLVGLYHSALGLLSWDPAKAWHLLGGLLSEVMGECWHLRLGVGVSLVTDYHCSLRCDSLPFCAEWLVLPGTERGRSPM